MSINHFVSPQELVNQIASPTKPIFGRHPLAPQSVFKPFVFKPQERTSPLFDGPKLIQPKQLPLQAAQSAGSYSVTSQGTASTITTVEQVDVTLREYIFQLGLQNLQANVGQHITNISQIVKMQKHPGSPDLLVQKQKSDTTMMPGIPYKSLLLPTFVTKEEPELPVVPPTLPKSPQQSYSIRLDFKELKMKEQQNTPSGQQLLKEVSEEEDSDWGNLIWQDRSMISCADIQAQIPKNVPRVQIKQGSQILPHQLRKVFKLSPGSQLSQDQLQKEFRIFKYKNPETKRTLKILKCDFEGCTKFFRKFHNFYDHLRIHTGERPFGCPFGCSLRFTQKSNLNKHIKCHMQTDTHVCQICLKNFKNINYLKRHLRLGHNKRINPARAGANANLFSDTNQTEKLSEPSSELSDSMNSHDSLISMLDEGEAQE